MKIDIEDLYRRYAPMVYRRCRYLLRDEEQAYDLMQDVFVALLRHQDSLNQNAPSSLLYTIATNLSLNAIKSRKSGRMTVLEEEAVSWIDPAHAITDSRDILESIFALEDEKTRTIAWLHYVDRMTLEETADQVGMSVSGIRKRLRKLQSVGRQFKEVLS